MTVRMTAGSASPGGLGTQGFHPSAGFPTEPHGLKRAAQRTQSGAGSTRSSLSHECQRVLPRAQSLLSSLNARAVFPEV